MSNPEDITAIAHIPFRDLVALRDEIELLRLAVYGRAHVPDEHLVGDMLERGVTRLVDQIAAIVADVEVTGGAHG